MARKLRGEPAMPPLEPSADSSVSALIERAQQRASAAPSGRPEFSFPADEDFWENFSTEAQLAPGGQQMPIFDVSASHLPGEPPLRVNQGFLRGFVGAWEERNPHIVTVRGPDSELQFHASHEFWNEVVGRLRSAAASRPPPPREDSVQIVSSIHPQGAPVVVNCDEWNDACNQWEQRKGLTAAQRAARQEHKRREIALKKGREREEKDMAEKRRKARRDRGSRSGGYHGGRRSRTIDASSDESIGPIGTLRRAYSPQAQQVPSFASFALSPASTPGAPLYCARCGCSLAASGSNARFCSQCGCPLQSGGGGRGGGAGPGGSNPQSLMGPRQGPSQQLPGGVGGRGEEFWAYGVLHYHIHNPHSIS
eukprot:Hpha_TRINITY_DN8071_c0_g1::TRINITY_DN8071_c0_g1_i1::g.140120::m.140120